MANLLLITTLLTIGAGIYYQYTPNLPIVQQYKDVNVCLIPFDWSNSLCSCRYDSQLQMYMSYYGPSDCIAINAKCRLYAHCYLSNTKYENMTQALNISTSVYSSNSIYMYFAVYIESNEFSSLVPQAQYSWNFTSLPSSVIFIKNNTIFTALAPIFIRMYPDIFDNMTKTTNSYGWKIPASITNPINTPNVKIKIEFTLRELMSNPNNWKSTLLVKDS